MNRLVMAFLCCLGFSFDPSSAAAQTRVDVELVLAVDASFSVDLGEQSTQRAGYVAALSDPEVIARIQSGLHGKIGLTFVEWGGPTEQYVIVSWMVIKDAASAAEFVQKLENAPTVRSNETSIAGALQFALELFQRSPFKGSRQVVDISGDGFNNRGAHILDARNLLIENGITINGLPLTVAARDVETRANLVRYFQDCVVGGANARLFEVSSWQDFSSALQRKLIYEISQAPPWTSQPGAPAYVQKASYHQSFDCLAGEKEELEKYYDVLDKITGGNFERWRVPEDVWPTPD